MHSPDTPGLARTAPGASAALALLLTINLFNYIDRQILSSVLSRLEADPGLFPPGTVDVKFWLGLLPSAFMLSYMLFSPVVGWLDGHGYRRWVILGLGVSVWSLASGGSGFATGYWMLFATRCLVGIGEGAYGPVASAMLADLYPPHRRMFVMALFNMAIPVGSALGFLIGGKVSDHFNDWRHAFWVTFLGLGLGAVCFFMREPARPRRVTAGDPPSYLAVLKLLARNRSFVLCCAGMTAVTFVIGGLGAWVPAYVYQREARFVLTPAVVQKLGEGDKPLPADVRAALLPLADGAERDFAGLQKLLGADLAKHFPDVEAAARSPATPSLATVDIYFGAILVLGGLSATAAGAWLGERLRRAGVRGAYFWVIGVGALASLPPYLLFLEASLPLGWVFAFLAIFGLFLHVGPGFTILANVVTSEVRATAFAINILVIHALGDVLSPPLIGKVAGLSSLHTAFWLTGAMIVVGGLLWIAGAWALDADTRRATEAEGNPPAG